MDISSNNKSYLHSLDLLRGMAALAVCTFHIAGGGNNFLDKNNLLRIISSYGHYGVEVFFVISGFIIPYSMYKGNYTLNMIKTFFLKRVYRIEPPYVVSILFIIFLNYISTLTPYYRGEPFVLNHSEIISHLGYLTEILNFKWLNPVYWTLAIEFQYYLLIAIIFPFLVSKKPIIWIVTLIIFNAIGFIITDYSYLFRYSFLFTLGILNFKYLFNHFGSKTFFLLVLFILALLFVRAGFANFVSALIPITFINFFNKSSKIGTFLGNISFSLYLLHMPVGGRVINLFSNFIYDEKLRVLVVYIAIFISIISAYIFYILIEKPSLKLSKRITYNDGKIKKEVTA